ASRFGGPNGVWTWSGTATTVGLMDPPSGSSRGNGPDDVRMLSRETTARLGRAPRALRDLELLLAEDVPTWALAVATGNGVAVEIPTLVPTSAFEAPDCDLAAAVSAVVPAWALGT